jgi:hypothetical protein
MRSKAPAITELRLQRFHRWALLWLKWFASFLDAANAYGPMSKQVTAIAHRWLGRIEYVLTCIVLIRVAAHVRASNPLKHSAHRRSDAQLMRALIGSSMRRALRSPRLDQRIAALSQNLEVWVARLLKRLPRGLTRRRPILTRPEVHRAEAAPICDHAPFCADTS